MNRFSDASLNRMVGVNKKLVEIAHRALELSPIDFGIPQYGGMRSAEEQNNLFHQGKSKCDGYRVKSNHQTGNALDVFAYVDGKASWEREHLAIVACAMLQAANELGYKLEWGGLWASFVDMPHFELKQ
jgi:peptidoglycan L-alanyl-D-glutamate endopeptidase CwlK